MAKEILKKVANKTFDVVTSDKAVNFAKETIKETAVDSIKTTGRYILLIIIVSILGIAGLAWFISTLV